METNQPQPQPAIDPEQAAHLALLQQQAASDPATVAEAEQAQAIEADKVPLSSEITGLLSAVVGILAPMLPTVAAIYTPEVNQAVGVSVGAVCDKHGWLQNGVMGQYGEEIACLFVVGPLAYSTYAAAKVDLSKLKQQDKAKQPGNAATLQPVALQQPVESTIQPGQKTVTFGAPAAVEA